MCKPPVCRLPRRPDEDVRSPATAVTGGCKQPDTVLRLELVEGLRRAVGCLPAEPPFQPTLGRLLYSPIDSMP